MDGSANPAVLPDEVFGALAADTRISKVELTGSRARGTATPLSDWDFAVATRSFDEVRDALPELVMPLRPVVVQWDRLSPIWCFMLILPGPVKVDLLFSHPHRPEGPWRVSAATLPGIDDHFWDWVLWLWSKLAAGRRHFVASELRKLHEHLLAPMGVHCAPASLGEAVTAYRSARGQWERSLMSHVSRAAENAVIPGLPVGHGVVPVMSQYVDPAQVGAGLRQDIIACWIVVSNAGGAAGFPFPPVDASIVAPVADDLLAGLRPDHSRLIVARAGDALAGWVHLQRHPAPVVAHWGTVSHLQTLPAVRGQGVGSALMTTARQIARQEMGLEQLHLAARGGMGLERFYAGLGWREIGRWPGALRLAPGDDRDEVLMILAPL